jgi:hypothetical protein
MRLMDTSTDTEIMPGAMLRPVEGPRRPWRFEGLATVHDVPAVHASQPTRTGRLHRHFHPHAFGLDVVIDVEISRREHVRNAVHVVRAKVNDYTLAGIFALIPLAFFEHFHMTERLFELFGSRH